MTVLDSIGLTFGFIEWIAYFALVLWSVIAVFAFYANMYGWYLTPMLLTILTFLVVSHIIAEILLSQAAHYKPTVGWFE